MFNFLRALSGITGISKQNNNVVFDDTSQYLYFDFGNDNNDRKVVKAPNPDADAVSYDNTTSGSSSTNIKDALDELFACLANDDTETMWTFDDLNEAVVITGAVYDDTNEAVTLSGILYTADGEYFTV